MTNLESLNDVTPFNLGPKLEFVYIYRPYFAWEFWTLKHNIDILTLFRTLETQRFPFSWENLDSLDIYDLPLSWPGPDTLLLIGFIYDMQLTILRLGTHTTLYASS